MLLYTQWPAIHGFEALVHFRCILCVLVSLPNEVCILFHKKNGMEIEELSKCCDAAVTVEYGAYEVGQYDIFCTECSEMCETYTPKG